jgi:hypothetical protein
MNNLMPLVLLLGKWKGKRLSLRRIFRRPTVEDGMIHLGNRWPSSPGSGRITADSEVTVIQITVWEE